MCDRVQRHEVRESKNPRRGGNPRGLRQVSADYIRRHGAVDEHRAARVDGKNRSTYDGFPVDADYYLISRYAASYNPTRITTVKGSEIATV